MKKNKRDKSIQSNKRKTAGIVWSVAAAVMEIAAAVLFDHHVMHRLQPVSTMAKESFGEIGRIVEEHDEDNPYWILDIVPSTACYDVQMQDEYGNMAETGQYCFSTGTMGYLTGEYTTLTQDFATVFANPAFRLRSDREELFHKIVPRKAADHFPGIRYEEAYGGVHDIVSGAEGWRLLFPSQDIDDIGQIDESAIMEMREGMFVGAYQKIRPGEEAKDYDYIALTAADDDRHDTEYYEYNADGAWHVIFSGAAEDTENDTERADLYEVDSVHAYDRGSYSLATGLYCLDENGQYCYAGTVAEVIGAESDDLPGGEESGGEGDTESSGADEENGGSISGNDVEPGSSAEEESDGTGINGIGAGEDDSIEEDDAEENDARQWRKLVEAGETEYYVVLFRRAENSSAANGRMYQVSGRELIVDGIRPFDAYDIAVLENMEEVVQADTAHSGLSTGGALRFIYVGEGRGNYKLLPSLDGTGDTLEVINAPVYMRCCSDSDWLKEYVFRSLPGGDNEESSFAVAVETVRADEVTRDMVRKADLVYLESGQHMFLDAADKADGVQGSFLVTDYIQKSDGGLNDMGESLVDEILRRASDELMPIIVDYGIIADGDNYQDTNYQYLARALLKQNLSTFYETMTQTGNLMENLRENIGRTEAFPDKTDNGCNYVNKNVYMCNGNTPLVCEDFYVPFDKDEAQSGFYEVIAAIEAENRMLPEDGQITVSVSKARAIQYIIHFSGGIVGELDDLYILEIQPTANLSSDLRRVADGEEGAGLYWQTQAMKAGRQIIQSKKTFDADIRVKSVVQFNGEREDINSVYDMVFIGLDGQRLNLGGDILQSPVYNKEGLNGKAYHSGDDSGVGVYDANDITEQKMADLLEYMAAGYPVLIEDDCFQSGTAKRVDPGEINTRYVGDDTVMYRFLASAVSDDCYRECIYTVSDAISNPMFMSQLKADRLRVEILAENQEEISEVQYLWPDEKGIYNGRIAYALKNNRGEDYLGDVVIHLYADMDYDGVFRPEEELNGYVSEDNVIDLAFGGMGPGILPWKMEVVEAGNAYRRDSVQGYFVLCGFTPKEIKVLQVTQMPEDSRVSLQEIYERKEDSVLAYYLHDAQKTAGVSFRFETVTAEELAGRLAQNANDLNQWDVVVLTLDRAVTIDSVTAAVDAYVKEGRSLLVCSQNGEGNRMGLEPELLGQKEAGRTYVSLGANGASGYYRYAGLGPDLFLPQTDLRFEQINEGTIVCYPYSMEEKSFYLGAEGEFRAADYLLDCDTPRTDDNAASVTVWYTFGGDAASAYGISPGDACNNYYCYSKGNVVWLGQAEYPYTYHMQDGMAPGAEEGSDACKFFVNALLAAYNAGVHRAKVSIVAGFAPDSVQVESIPIPFDQEWQDAAEAAAGILDHTVEVYFKFTDSNIAIEKNMELQFYYEDPGGEEMDLCGEAVYATQFESEVWTVMDNQLVSVGEGGLEAGRIYQIKAPVMALGDNSGMNEADIYVVLSSDILRSGKTYHMTGSGAVSLNRVRLFPLE